MIKVWCAESGEYWKSEGSKAKGQRRTCPRCRRSVKITAGGAISYHLPPHELEANRR